MHGSGLLYMYIYGFEARRIPYPDSGLLHIRQQAIRYPVFALFVHLLLLVADRHRDLWLIGFESFRAKGTLGSPPIGLVSEVYDGQEDQNKSSSDTASYRLLVATEYGLSP